MKNIIYNTEVVEQANTTDSKKEIIVVSNSCQSVKEILEATDKSGLVISKRILEHLLISENYEKNEILKILHIFHLLINDEIFNKIDDINSYYLGIIKDIFSNNSIDGYIEKINKFDSIKNLHIENVLDKEKISKFILKKISTFSIYQKHNINYKHYKYIKIKSGEIVFFNNNSFTIFHKENNKYDTPIILLRGKNFNIDFNENTEISLNTKRISIKNKDSKVVINYNEESILELDLLYISKIYSDKLVKEMNEILSINKMEAENYLIKYEEENGLGKIHELSNYLINFKINNKNDIQKFLLYFNALKLRKEFNLKDWRISNTAYKNKVNEKNNKNKYYNKEIFTLPKKFSSNINVEKGLFDSIIIQILHKINNKKEIIFNFNSISINNSGKNYFVIREYFLYSINFIQNTLPNIDIKIKNVPDSLKTYFIEKKLKVINDLGKENKILEVYKTVLLKFPKDNLSVNKKNILLKSKKV